MPGKPYNPNMVRSKRLYTLEDEAITSAKKRAQTAYKTQYVYKNGDGLFFVRSELVNGQQWLLKVTSYGKVERYEEKEEEN